MQLYVCRPTGERCVAACREHGFGALLSPLSVRKTARGHKLDDLSGFTTPISGLPYVIDNGAWSCHVAGKPWREEPFLRLLERIGLDDRGHYREGLGRGFAVLPDLVGGGEASLDRSVKWWLRHRQGIACDAVASWLLAVQDGMSVDVVRRAVERYRFDGVFVGGSTAWKWTTVHEWAELGLDLGASVHVGRVNSLRRALLCRDLGVSSIDGSSVSRFSVNAPLLSRSTDGEDRPLPAPGKAREHLPEPLRQRIADLEPRARHAIAERRFRLALGAAA